MATDWSAEQLSAYNDIKEDGFSLVIRKPGSPGEFDPDTMVWVDPTAPVDISTFAIRKEFTIGQVDGSIIQQGDSLLILSAYGVPSDFDTTYQLLIESNTQNVVHISPLSPGNVPVLFNIQVRT